VLVSKILQNLANNTLPGKKEGFMEHLNDFVTANIDKLNKFFDQAAVKARGTVISPQARAVAHSIPKVF
jgi:DNA-binding protein